MWQVKNARRLATVAALAFAYRTPTQLASAFLPSSLQITTTPTARTTATRHLRDGFVYRHDASTCRWALSPSRFADDQRLPTAPVRITSSMLASSPNVLIKKDVVVIGGGLAGLSTALELAKRGRQVTVLSRDRGEAAAEAAGGMIAPQSERLESGPYLDLCLRSRSMYADWVEDIEAIAGLGEEGGKAATTHFWSTGGFLSPAFEGDAVHTWDPPPEGGQAHWLEREQALEMEPSLSRHIVGAWWFPQDMSIDAQRMFGVLELACLKAGVEIFQGSAAASLVYSGEGSSVDAVILEDGRRFHTNTVVSAAGAWMRELMPVPMLPHKGQMMSLREPAGGAGGGAPRQGGGIGLTRVFFAEGCYIIPKRDGRIVVGSTVEVGEYGQHNTPAGMKQIIDAAIKVCPALADLAIERTWAGLRPVTPDSHPVLGTSCHCSNLFVAGGYWRNGVLLAPKTAQLVADAVCGCLSAEDQDLVEEFSMDRFISPGRSPRRDATTDRAGSFATYSSEAAALPSLADTPRLFSADEASIVLEGYGSGRGSGATGVTQSEILEMERAALEGMNDGSSLSGLEGLYGKRTEPEGRSGADRVGVPAEDELMPSQYEEDSAAIMQLGESEEAPSNENIVSTPGQTQEPVNDYDASTRFSEDSLRSARMANRLLDDGSDARLEELFGDGPEPVQLPEVLAWDVGAEEVARMMGAEIVELDMDVPDGMSLEQAQAMFGQESIVKVMWESPNGTDIEIPRGMNVASMVEAGLINPLDQDDEDRTSTTAARAVTENRKHKNRETTPRGVFDPTAVRGPEARSPEVSDLYAKVMANKAKARAEAESSEGLSSAAEVEASPIPKKSVGKSAGATAAAAAAASPAQNGYVEDQGDQGTRSWFGDMFRLGGGSPGTEEHATVAVSRESVTAAGDGVHKTGKESVRVHIEGEAQGSGEDGDGVEEMVGYDFILQDRDDVEGEIAARARASMRHAAEGEDAWAQYEDIASAAMAEMEGMGQVERIPPR